MFDDITLTEDMDHWQLGDRILQLERILQSGETTTSIDGTSTTVDLTVIRQQLAALNERRDLLLGRAPRKPRIASIDLGGWQ